MSALDPIKKMAYMDIDKSASELGMSLLTHNSPYILEEYKLTEQNAKEWLADTTKPCPQSITVWAQIAGITNEESANHIIFQSQEYAKVIEALRALRLQNKARVNVAVSLEEIQSILAEHKATLDYIKENASY